MRQLTGKVIGHAKLVGHKWGQMAHTLKWHRKSALFWRCDAELLKAYFLKNPYHMSAEGLPFGHTPLSEMERMTKVFGIKKSDRVLELGCGTGRTCFWLRAALGCSVRGVDLSKPFIEKAQKISNKLHLDIPFEEGCLLDTDFSWPSVVYFYATAFPEEILSALCGKLALLPEGSLVITISEPLRSPDLYLFKRLQVCFPWGKAFAFCHKKTKSLR